MQDQIGARSPFAEHANEGPANEKEREQRAPSFQMGKK
jgi:hypothetical protein